MKSKKSFAVVGGDLRQVKMANSLANDGHYVKVYGFQNIEFLDKVVVAKDIGDVLENTKAVIMPLPISLDNETVNVSFFDEKIYLDDVFQQMSKNHILLGGRISEKIHNLARIYSIYTIDYFEREELTVLNAIPTAEGAIQIAMEELPITLHNSQCLVLGFGRIGKILARKLWGIGAKVTVEARKYEDLAWIKSYGYEGIHLNQLSNHIDKYDVIFNTIPSVILTEEILSKIKPDCLVIDLASKPGGVDFEMAKNLGIKAIWALSLPGKVAPNTAGEIIKDTVINIMNELGV